MRRSIVIMLLATAMALVCVGIVAVLYFTVLGGRPAHPALDQRTISSQVEEEKTIQVNAEEPLTVKVATAAGHVTVTGADVDTVQVRAIKTAHDSSQARADAEVKDLRYTIEQKGNTVFLTYELPRSMNPGNSVNTVDFEVTVPQEITVEVTGGMGNVAIAGTRGNVTVTNDFGDVRLEDIDGALSVRTNSGAVTATSIRAGKDDIALHSEFGSVSLQNASGTDITLGSNSGRITLGEVRATGAIEATTAFGDASVENGSGGSLTVATNSGRVTLAGMTIRGAIKVQDDFGEIALDRVFAASYDLHTNSGSITLTGVQGRLKAQTDFGAIQVEDAQDVTLDLKTNSGTVAFSGSLGPGPHLVTSGFGEIILTLPEDIELNVELSTDFGSIESEIPVTVTRNGTSPGAGDEMIGTVNGGGDVLTVKTNSGRLTIRAGR